MISKSSSLLRLAAVAMVLGIGLAGCGRKNDPELATATKPQASDRPIAIPLGPSTPDKPKPPKEKKPFLLDPLL